MGAGIISRAIFRIPPTSRSSGCHDVGRTVNNFRDFEVLDKRNIFTCGIISDQGVIKGLKLDRLPAGGSKYSNGSAFIFYIRFIYHSIRCLSSRMSLAVLAISAQYIGLRKVSA